MDIYIVRDGETVIGASAKLQGAELIRANEARTQAEEYCDRNACADPVLSEQERIAYDRMTIENTELQDVE